MASLKDIKRKVSAVQKTKQITRAMNMVAASKFKSAQVKMENFRPYAGKFMDVLNSLALRVDASTHPLLAVRDPKKIRVICMTSDRGLCGGFNSNLIKATERFLREKAREGREIALINVGRKGRDFFRKKANVIAQKTDVLSKFDMTLAVSIADEVIEPFIKAEYDELYLIYNQFVNVSVQKPTVVRLFPLPSIGNPDADIEPDKR
ncbi:MAG: F0F1 ATP synthase subunit gamma, partial [Smithellaceae bacterium]